MRRPALARRDLSHATRFRSQPYPERPRAGGAAAGISNGGEDASWALTIPLVIVGGIRFGVFTPTEVGAISPPVGTLIYTTCSITRVSVTDISRELWPFITVSILCLFLFTYVPDTVLFLPNLLLGP
jgi:TRAP-type C4-dicarboxylate transport system permease large subunit